MQYTVRNSGAGGEGEEAGIRVQMGVSGIACRSGCSPIDTITDSANFTATLVAPDVAQGQTQEVTITVTATEQGNGSVSSDTQTLRVKGPDAPQTVRQVSGRVKSSDGERLSGVAVAMNDSAGHQYNTQTNAEGLYSFTSSDSQPIAPGAITVGALKDGFQAKTVNVQGGAGRSVNVQITLKKLASASPSASPSASVSASAEPTEEEAVDDEATDEASDAAAAPNTDNAAAEADGGTNWLLIIMGVLLVAAGIGAFALVWLRRKNSEEEPAEEAASPGFGGATPAPAGAGAFDATRVASPVGAARGGDATMIAPAAGMAGGISDAPTMVHRPAEDEFPDPYGAPMPPQGGFAGAGNQWDDQGANGYGGQQYGGQQYGGQQYGQQQGGFDQQQGYDEHTNMYQPQQPQRYDEHTSLYQPQQGGYDDQGGWGGQGDAGNGYGPQGGYDQQGGAYGGYDQQQQGGYGAGQQYGGQQYGQQGGFDQQQGGAYSGYDHQQGGYGDQDEYYDPQNGQPGQHPPNNRNNWNG